MKKQTAEKLQFGRKRNAKKEKTPLDSADRALLCGIVTLGVLFFGILTGEESAKAYVDGDAVPVMSILPTQGEETLLRDADTVKEYLRKNSENGAALSGGEPFGYMDGKWNLWEYLGDVMADLLMGG